MLLLERGYIEPLTLDDSESKFIGLWEGSFTIKNAKNGSQQVNESFFIHGIAGTTDLRSNKLSELPPEPVSSLFKYAISDSSSITSEIQPLRIGDSVGMDIVAHDRKDSIIEIVGVTSTINNHLDARKKSKHENIEFSLRKSHLVGFGRKLFPLIF